MERFRFIQTNAVGEFIVEGHDLQSAILLVAENFPDNTYQVRSCAPKGLELPCQTIVDICKNIMVLWGELDTGGVVVSLHTMANLAEILLDSKEDYIVFNNAGGQVFTIWKGMDVVSSLVGDEHTSPYIYAYRLNAEDTIIKRPIGRQYPAWIGIERVAADYEHDMIWGQSWEEAVNWSRQIQEWKQE